MMYNGQTLSGIRKKLKELAGLHNPPEEAEAITRLILDHFGYNTGTLILSANEPADPDLIMQINKIVPDLEEGRPVQYILGSTFFYDLHFRVNEAVLIPRQETEEMVDHIIRENKGRQGIIWDIGTGSGCIAVSLARYLPGMDVLASDISEEALAMAKENALLNDSRVTFILADIFADPPFPETFRAQIIVSNPPYVTVAEKAEMSQVVTENEPALALFVPTEDPLLYYRRIALLAAKHLNDSGVIWLEINEKFGAETAALFREAGFGMVELLRDIRKKDRFLKICK